LKYFKNRLFSYKTFTATLSETFRRQTVLDRGKYRCRACLWAWSTISCLWAWSTISCLWAWSTISCLWELTRPKQEILLTKRTALIFFQGLHNTSCLNASSFKSFYINHVWSRSPTIKRGTPRRDSNQGNQMWPIHVVFATDQHHISGEVLRFKFPAFVRGRGKHSLILSSIARTELACKWCLRERGQVKMRALPRLFDGNIGALWPKNIMYC